MKPVEMAESRYGTANSTGVRVGLRTETAEEKLIKRPAEAKRAAGLSGFRPKIQEKTQELADRVKGYVKNYVQNVRHTFDHKIVYALVEKELFGANSINSLTHDADKLILYVLGFPRSFVSDFHKKHSTHHCESGKELNLKSMLCDNVASSPEFKPEKKYSLREHYNKSKELQKIEGLEDILEKYHYGEDLNFQKIKSLRNGIKRGITGFIPVLKSMTLRPF